MSEIKQINTGVAELLAILLPEGAKVLPTIYPHAIVYELNNAKSCISLPSEWHNGNWTPLGLSTQLTEEQCREVVGSEKVIVQGVYPIVTYNGMETAKEALASLMQANGINGPRLILKAI